jgi:hypothetical protein
MALQDRRGQTYRCKAPVDMGDEIKMAVVKIDSAQYTNHTSI